MKKTIDTSIFKSYDIRGIYPDQLDENVFGHIVRSMFKVLYEKVGKTDGEPISIVISHDMRLSAPKLFPMLRETLLLCGAHVVDIGLASTPTLYFATNHYGHDAGIQLSASHNPPQYNGAKMVYRTKTGLEKIGKGQGMEEIMKATVEFTQTADFIKSLHLKKGTLTTKEEVLKEEVEHAIKMLGISEIRPLKIVADAANAMGSLYIEELLKHIPCDLIKMNFELDGSFPAHQPDPLVAANLKSLQERVIAENADLGLAPDGDGDRLFFITEKGDVVPASIVTAIVSKELLGKNKGATILYDIRYTMTAKRIIEENGGKSGITRVGHFFITKQMNETGAIFAGESSGHFYYKDNGNTESQLPTILSVLKALSVQNKKLSQLMKEFTRSFESGEVNFECQNSQEIIEQLKSKYIDGKLLTIDGVSVDYPTWRFGVRTSNTEPLMRLNLEAITESEMLEKKEELKSFIISLGAKLVNH